MNYQRKSFSVAMGGGSFADRWEQTFGKKATEETCWHLCRHDILQNDCGECPACECENSKGKIEGVATQWGGIFELKREAEGPKGLDLTPEQVKALTEPIE